MLIVNADDFGLAKHINQGIIETIEARAVNSVSLVANGTAFDEAAAYLKNNKNTKCGIHFTLIEETPLSDPYKIRTLITANGKFERNYRTFIKKYFLGKINIGEVREELELQIKKISHAGINIMHCDSHQHLHLLPKIGQVVIDLCRKHNIPRVRIVNEKVDIRYPAKVMPLVAMNYFSNILSKKALGINMNLMDRFLGFNCSMRLNQNIINKALQLSRKYNVELMCHPGNNTTNALLYNDWQMDWEREKNILINSLKGKLN